MSPMWTSEIRPDKVLINFNEIVVLTLMCCNLADTVCTCYENVFTFLVSEITNPFTHCERYCFRQGKLYSRIMETVFRLDGLKLWLLSDMRYVSLAFSCLQYKWNVSRFYHSNESWKYSTNGSISLASPHRGSSAGSIRPKLGFEKRFLCFVPVHECQFA